MSGLLTIDATEVRQLGTVMGTAGQIVTQELGVTVRALSTEGIRLAQGFAPVRLGKLRGHIRLVQAPALQGTTVTAVYGVTDVIYARIQEQGGTIVPRKGKFLRFRGRGGQWVFARSVTLTGKRYIGRSADALQQLAPAAMDAAAGRIARRIEAVI